MNYRISETTDGKYIGQCFNIDQFFIGNEINLGVDFIFEINNLNNYGNLLVASNANYVVILKQEESDV